jgi:hypothetical protein
VLVQGVLEQKHPKDMGELNKTQLLALQKAMYFALYGVPFLGQGKKGAAGQVEFGDVHSTESPFKGAPPSSGSPTRLRKTPNKKKVTGKA